MVHSSVEPFGSKESFRSAWSLCSVFVDCCILQRQRVCHALCWEGKIPQVEVWHTCVAPLSHTVC